MRENLINSIVINNYEILFLKIFHYFVIRKYINTVPDFKLVNYQLVIKYFNTIHFDKLFTQLKPLLELKQ